MRSYPLAEARASLSQLVDRALAGEPQRVTRRGRDAVVIVSEREWTTREASGETPAMPDGRPVETFADALIALGSVEGLAELLEEGRSTLWTGRPLGSDFDDG